MKKLLLILSALYSVVVMAQDKLEIPDFTIEPGGTQTISVELTNETKYAGFNMNIILPEGFSFATYYDEDAEEEKMDIRLDGARVNGHSLTVSTLSTGATRLLSFAMPTTNFKGNSGAILNMVIKAADNVVVGEQSIKITEIKFSPKTGEGTILEDYTKTFKVVKYYNISATSADAAKGNVTVEGAGERVGQDMAVTATATPVAGYSFVNWAVGETEKSTDNPYTFTATENVALVANFKANKYDVVFDVDGVKTTTTLDFGTAITKPADPAKEGYTFTGWSPAFAEGATVPVDGITYVAQWQINTYKVIYKVDGKEYKSVDVKYGDAITAEAVPTKEGHTFSGWSEIPATMPANDVEVTGAFTANKYDVVFDVDGVKTTTTLDFGTAITKPADPTKVGYTFTGWSPAFAEGATVPVDGITYVAQWQINTYKVVYKVDGKEYKSVDVKYGDKISAMTAPTKEGHTFDGWSDIPATMPAKNVEVTGKFTVNTYKVIYKVDGKEYKTVEVKYGEKIPAMAAPTKEGYLFSGWSEIPATMPAKDITVTGSFAVNAIYGVTVDTKVDVYNLNGVKVASDIAVKDLDTELEKGIYIINGKKYWVK